MAAKPDPSKGVATAAITSGEVSGTPNPAGGGISRCSTPRATPAAIHFVMTPFTDRLIRTYPTATFRSTALRNVTIIRWTRQLDPGP
jgi:hypothetical protein